MLHDSSLPTDGWAVGDKGQRLVCDGTAGRASHHFIFIESQGAAETAADPGASTAGEIEGWRLTERLHYGWSRAPASSLYGKPR